MSTSPQTNYTLLRWKVVLMALLVLTFLRFLRSQLPNNSASRIIENEFQAKAQSVASIDGDRRPRRDYSQYMKQYRILDEACLENTGNESSRLYVLLDPQPQKLQTNSSVTETGAVNKKKKRDDFHKIIVFQNNTFVEHVLHITYLNESEHHSLSQRGGIRRQGTTMLMAHHTPNNNFHLQNDLLLFVWRAYHLHNINRLLLFRGCEDCWAKRLPLMGRIFESMQLEVVYPIEDMPLQCFEKIVLQRKDERPYYSHKGRFDESFWPQDFFFGYRDHVHAYFKALFSNNSSTTSANLQDSVPKSMFRFSSWRPDDKTVISEKSKGSSATVGNSRPILTWVSRSRYNDTRYVDNEREALQALLEYFEVNLIDFANRSFTVDESLANIIKTNVLVGMHGAGLAYTALLQNNSMLVEIKGKFGSEKKMFMNMASKLDIPYYAIHPDVQGEVVTLANVSTFATEVYDAWVTEQNMLDTTYSGECTFPWTVYPLNHLSASNISRCYLEQSWRHNFEWYQCVHFNRCY